MRVVQSVGLQPILSSQRLLKLVEFQPDPGLLIIPYKTVLTAANDPFFDRIAQSTFQRLSANNSEAIATALRDNLPPGAATDEVIADFRVDTTKNPEVNYTFLKNKLFNFLNSEAETYIKPNLALETAQIFANPQGNIDNTISELEQVREQEFEKYLGKANERSVLNAASIRETLVNITAQTGKKPAVIYTVVLPNQLEIVLVTPKGESIRKSVPNANREALLKVSKEFISQTTDPTETNGYLAPSKQLYQWIIAPLEEELAKQGIDTLLFSLDTGIRSLPLAALHDGQKFLVEKYNIGLIPSVSLTDTRYAGFKNTPVLGFGASRFKDLPPLPAVPLELSTIAPGLWPGKSFLNEEFTLKNVKSQREKEPFKIVHLATHAQFNPGAINNSYIQLWDTKLRMDQLRQLGWKSPIIELLVLSACHTALGNEDAELGFAGFAVAAGVKSALASLWYVSDEGTLGLMTNFYEKLKHAPIKAEALRQAQIDMLKGQVRVQGSQLITPSGKIPLPASFASRGNQTLKHPYYWAAFTMIGSPW